MISFYEILRFVPLKVLDDAKRCHGSKADNDNSFENERNYPYWQTDPLRKTA